MPALSSGRNRPSSNVTYMGRSGRQSTTDRPDDGAFEQDAVSTEKGERNLALTLAALGPLAEALLAAPAVGAVAGGKALSSGLSRGASVARAAPVKNVELSPITRLAPKDLPRPMRPTLDARPPADPAATPAARDLPDLLSPYEQQMLRKASDAQRFKDEVLLGDDMLPALEPRDLTSPGINVKTAPVVTEPTMYSAGPQRPGLSPVDWAQMFPPKKPAVSNDLLGALAASNAAGATAAGAGLIHRKNRKAEETRSASIPPPIRAVPGIRAIPKQKLVNK